MSRPTPAGVQWIDTTFDVRSDAGDRDPDIASPTLRRYHQILWSKPLPSGDPFDLDTTQSYLHHSSWRGEFSLSSDNVTATFLRWKRLFPITSQLSDFEKTSFDELKYTIGGTMVFPAQKVDGALTINGARGFLPRIGDRVDLTLECIRRHYLDEESPLGPTLRRYSNFFALFEDFQGYVNFFLLDDLVNHDGTAVTFFSPFDNFESAAAPSNVETYREYRRASMAFIRARNRRIDSLPTQVRPRSKESRGTVLGAPPAVVLGRLRKRRR